MSSPVSSLAKRQKLAPESGTGRLRVAILIWLCMVNMCPGEDLAALVADRTAIERVYYQHRLGSKPAFEQVLPPATITKLVEQESQKERVLAQVYHTQISTDQVATEIRRMENTSRAPEVLAELRRALDHDTHRFAQTVVRPLIVERELRARFENDDPLHQAERKQIEMARNAMLTAKSRNASPSTLARQLREFKPGVIHEVSWHLNSRPVVTPLPTAQAPALNGGTTIVTGGLYSAETRIAPAPNTTQPAAIPIEESRYFDDLPPELQRVLRAQLNTGGDISAVLELPGCFMLYLALDKTPTTLKCISLTIYKRSYEAWLADQARRLERAVVNP